MRAIPFTLLAVTVFAATACNESPRTLPPIESVADVREFMQSIVTEPGGAPSLSVAVALNGEVVFAEAAGVADVKLQTPATADTRYRTYSISKGVTAVAIMQLVESGDVRLDDDIRTYVPAFPAKRWPITIAHLLTHTSGIRHYKKNAGEISSTVEYPDLAASLDVFKDDPLEFEPGTAVRYTSFGFNLLTGVIEAASGQSFGDYLRTHVFEPAGMSTATLAIAARTDVETAPGYWPPGGLRRSHRRIDDLPSVSGRYGSSGVVASAGDLVRLFTALEEGKLMSLETVERMFSEPFPDIAPGQAYGWNLDREGGAIYRTGAGKGYVALAIHNRGGVSGALLVNQNQWKGRVEVLQHIMRYFGQLAS